MTKQEFQKLTENHVLLLDGATGSNLMKAGMPRGVCTESWVLEHKDVIQSLQKAYIEQEAISSMRLPSAETVLTSLCTDWRIRSNRSIIPWPAIQRRLHRRVFSSR